MCIRSSRRPLLVLVAGVLVAGASMLVVGSATSGQVEARLEERADRVEAVLGLQLRQYEATSRAVAGLVRHAQSQADFAAQVSALGLADELPGIYALNVTTRVTPSELAGYLADERASGSAGFTVRPEPSGGTMFVIDRVSPFQPNAGALGFDVMSNPDAAVAVRRAVQLGVPSLSDALTLVQEPGDQTGLVMYLPWYAEQGELAGVTSVVLRGQDFLDALSLGDVGVTVVDLSTSSGARALGTIAPAGMDPDGMSTKRVIEVYGQDWELTLVPPAGFASFAERSAAIVVPLAILALAGLGAWLVAAIVRSEEHARQQVEQRTGELVDVNARLHQALAAKDEFLAVLGHEFRTPLTVIRGFAATLRAGRVGPVTKDVDTVLDRIEAQAAKLDGLVDDLLTAAKLQEGRVEVRAELVDVLRLLEELADAHHGQLGTVVVEATSDLIVEVDRAHASRIFSALLSNAAKYGAAPVTLTAAAADGMVEVRVADSGPGVPAAIRGSLFDAFEQADSGSTRRSRGVGLGLAIVRELCERNDGSVELVDTDQPGACFAVSLPRVAVLPDVPSVEHVFDDQR